MEKKTTRDDEVKELRFKTGKHDNEILLKSLKIDNGCNGNYFRSLNKEKIFLKNSETLIASSSGITKSALSILNPSVAIVLTSIRSLVTSIALLNTNEYISKLKLKKTKTRD